MSDASVEGSHYREGDGDMETWDAILEVFGLDGLASSVMRYVTRYEYKDDPESDLRKAIRYIDKMIEHFADQDGDVDLDPLPVDVVRVSGGLFGRKGYQVAAVVYLCKFQYDGDAVGDLREARRAVDAMLRGIGGAECDSSEVISIDTGHPHWPYDVHTSSGEQGPSYEDEVETEK